MRLLKLLLVLFVCAAGPAVAGPFEDGVVAAQKGDYATAMKIWKTLAENGDGRAQYRLGWIYYQGKGIPRDYMEAARWYELSAARGFAEAQVCPASKPLIRN